MMNIDSAPKDGTQILAKFESGGIAVVYWCQRYSDKLASWSFSNSSSFCRKDPVGWKPLPENFQLFE